MLKDGQSTSLMTFGCLDCLEAQFSHKCGISAGRVHINASLVKFNVERAIGVPVGQVNVHVEGLRISSPD